MSMFDRNRDELRPAALACPDGRRAASPCEACEARSLSVCAAATDAAMTRMSDLTEIVRYAPGQPLAREGEPMAHVFNVTGGAVRVYKLTADGRRQITGFLFPGDFLGLSPGQTYRYTAEAITPSQVCRFSRAAYDKVVARYPELERALYERAGAELAAAHEQILMLGRKTATEKVAAFLLDLARRGPAAGQAPDVARLVMTRGEAADYLGLTLETVSRVLSRLKNRRLIRQSESDAYQILDRPALEALTGD
jgi:CRP/FNR family transcriptional regulator